MSEQVEHMLTTIDNPFNPFTHFDEWLQYDVSHGYNTSGLLARIAIFSFDLSDEDQELAIEAAIDECVRENSLGNLKKISRP